MRRCRAILARMLYIHGAELMQRNNALLML